MKAHYCCLNCSHEWLQQNPVAPTACHKCGHLYVKWLNYTDFVK